MTPSIAGETSPAGSPRERADRVCAEFGPDFVAGDAPGHCVRVEQRLRVERNARRDMSPWDAPPAFAPLDSAAGALPARLRLNGGFGLGRGRQER